MPNYQPAKSDAEKVDEIVKWMSPRDFSRVHEQFLENVVPGTGKWFLESDQFNSWRSKRIQHLWVSGKPGAGKSFLSSIVINELKNSKEACQLAFLYLSYKQEPLVEDLLGNLAGQLIKHRIDPSIPKCVLSLWDEEAKKISAFETAPRLAQIVKLVSDLVTKDTFLVIDALDEYDSHRREDLLDRLTTIQNVNLLITSRDKSTGKFETIDISANHGDIYNYVSQAISGSGMKHLVCRDEDLKEEIKQTVTQKAEGLFLLARLYVQALTACSTPRDARDTLKELPRDRKSMYEITLERIGKEERKRRWAMTIFGWVLHAGRPLEIEELRHALLIGGAIDQPLKINDDQLDHGNLLSAEDIVTFCCGLVEIETATNCVGTFRFIHYSTQEYFDATKDKHFPDFQSRVALACAKYISLPRLASLRPDPGDQYTDGTLQDGPSNYSEELKEYLRLEKICKARLEQGLDCRCKEDLCVSSLPPGSYYSSQGVAKALTTYLKFLLYPFIKYAGPFLHFHFSNIREGQSRLIVEEQIQQILQAEGSRRLLSRLLASMSSVSLRHEIDHVAHLGSTRLVERYLRVSNQQPYLAHTLRVATPSAVKVILSDGDVTNLTSPYGYLLLHRAVRRGYSREVQQVIEEIRGNLEKLDEIERSKPWTARLSLWEEPYSLQLTTRHFGEIYPNKLGDHIRLLSASSNRNSAATLALLNTKTISLLARDMDRNDPILKIKSFLIKTAFFLAVENRDIQTMEAFLDHGLDVNVQGFIKSQTALHCAVSQGSESVVELLLRYNPRMDLKDECGKTVWELLSSYDAGTFKLLLLASAANQSVLSSASEMLVRAVQHEWSTSSVLVILNAGLNPSIESASGRNPLQVAVKRGNPAMVELLLKHKADPNTFAADGRTLLDKTSDEARLLMKQIYGKAVDPDELRIRSRCTLNREESELKDKHEIIRLLKSFGGKTAEELKTALTSGDQTRTSNQGGAYYSDIHYLLY
ncbi:uncharacterized protein BKA78DRAFT_296821 [Phyllosticta capitalensis]|uniref:uncharacterized protein n=1 Tax=Phyllosticta capitalensis TaxID=121624 RepID=UPI00312FF48C